MNQVKKRRFGRWTRCLLVAGSAAAPIAVSAEPAQRRAPATVERRVAAMGTLLIVTVEAEDRASALAASEAAVRGVAEVEGRLSTWDPSSELSRLNAAAAGAVVRISPRLERDLRLATAWWQVTGGVFDPAIASLMEAWGLRDGGRIPSDSELASALAASGLDHLDLGPGTARFDVAGFAVDAGGFGKGIALLEAREAALDAGAGCVVLDLGGQVEIGGDCRQRSLGIADPARRHRSIATLRMGAGSVATSGNSERGIESDDVTLGHLLDPRTGRPAPDWGTVTVVADDPVAADCLSTALYIMGSRRGADWVRRRPGIEAVFVATDTETMTIAATPGLEGRLAADGTVSLLFLAPLGG